MNYILGIGGEQTTLRILGDMHPAFDGTTGKAGYVINRHTLANATSPTQVEGVLVLDHQGYYTPLMQGQAQGIVAPQVATLSGASLLPPIAWPYTNPGNQQNAYTWISNQLCCSDIRTAYVNLNASPSVWLTQLEQLTYPSDHQ